MGSKSVEKVRLQSLRSSRIPPVCVPKKRLWEPQIPPKTFPAQIAWKEVSFSTWEQTSGSCRSGLLSHWLRDPTGKWRASGISQQSILHQGYLPILPKLQILEAWLLGKAAQIPKNAGELIMINRKKSRKNVFPTELTPGRGQPHLWSCSPWAPLGSSQKDARAPGQSDSKQCWWSSQLQAMSTRARNPGLNPQV